MNSEKKRKSGVGAWVVPVFVIASLLISVAIGITRCHLPEEAEKEIGTTDRGQTDRQSSVPEIPQSEYQTTVSERAERPDIDVSVMTRNPAPTLVGGYIEYPTEQAEGERT